MKQFDKKGVFSWANAENARQYVGKFGYFADECCEDLENWQYGKLTQIHPDHEVTEIFECYDTNYPYGLFIPADKVKEKTYRQFRNCTELCQYVTPNSGVVLNVGDMVTIRNKENGYTYRVLVTEICYDSKFIGLGTCSFSLIELHNQYEWQDVLNKTWQPFGVEVKE